MSRALGPKIHGCWCYSSLAASPIIGSKWKRHRGDARDGPPGKAAVWQDEDPPGEPFWLSALFWLLGTVYVLTVLLNFWSAIAGLFQ